MAEIITLTKWNKLTRYQRRLLVEFLNGLLTRQSKKSSNYGFDNSTCVNGTELNNPYITTKQDKSYQ